jgi:signal transduction histidine kinase
MAALRQWALAFRFLGSTFRVTLLFSGLFAVSSLALFAFVYWQTALVETTRIDSLLIEDGRYLSRQTADALTGIVENRVMPGLRPVTYVALFDQAQRFLAGNFTDFPKDLPLDGVAHRFVAKSGGVSDRSEVIRAVAIRLPDGRIVMLGRNIDSLDNLRGALIRALKLGVIPAIVLSLGAGALLGQRTHRKLQQVHASAERIMRGSLRERLPTRGGGDDFDRLAISVNAMLDEIARLMEDMKSTGDNIAHDLRTPLTRVRTRLERARNATVSREDWQQVIDRAVLGVDQALRLITALLRIGDIEAGQRRAAFQPLDLPGLVQEIVELYDPLAEEKGIALRLALAPVGLIRGDHDLLCELLSNVVDNAIKFTPPGGAVVLSVSDGPQGPLLRVADNGPGIAADQREAVFQRFFRSDASRSVEGYGLGLSLVAAIAKLHGFRFALDDNQPGCVFVMHCPGI